MFLEYLNKKENIKKVALTLRIIKELRKALNSPA